MANPGFRIEPKELLKFTGPYTVPTICQMKFTNPSKNAKLAFKFKTNTKSLYNIRPHCGVVEPGKTVSVQVELKPIDPQELHRGSKWHIFLVQELVLPDAKANTDVLVLFRNTPESEMVIREFRCVFEDNSPKQDNSTQTDDEAPQLSPTLFLLGACFASTVLSKERQAEMCDSQNLHTICSPSTESLRSPDGSQVSSEEKCFRSFLSFRVNIVGGGKSYKINNIRGHSTVKMLKEEFLKVHDGSKDTDRCIFYHKGKILHDVDILDKLLYNKI